MFTLAAKMDACAELFLAIQHMININEFFSLLILK